MATITNAAGTVAGVDSYKGALRTSLWPAGAAYAAAGTSGVIAATTNGTLWAARLNPNGPTTYRAYITRLYISWVTITAFTTPATIRNLLVSKSSAHATPTAVTTITPIAKDPSDLVSGFSTTANGLITICTTTNLTITGITWDAATLQVLDFTGAGAASGTKVLDWNAVDGGGPIVLLPGQLLGLRTSAALDAAGTGNLTVGMEWFEGAI